MVCTLEAVTAAGWRLVAGALAVASGSLYGCGATGRTPATSNDGDDPAPVFTNEQLATLGTLSSAMLTTAPLDSSNRWADDQAAALFGRKMFFDPAISGQLLDGDNDGSANALGSKGDTGKVSCAGCHLPNSGFSDTRTIRKQTSLAAGWGKRRAPSLLDVAQSKLLMWDGRRDALYNQIFSVVESAVEMNSSRLFAAEQVYANHQVDYETLFGKMPPFDDLSRFPALTATQTGCRGLDANNTCLTSMRGAPGDGKEFDALSEDDQRAVTGVIVNVGKAIGAYERLLTCGQSRFDRWVQGDSTSLSRSEQRGALIFADRGRCITCHTGPYLSDEQFHNVGLKPTTVATVFLDSDDHGAAAGLPQMQGDPLNVRGAFSDGDDGRDPQVAPTSMEGAFRTPRLRCSVQRPSFMHTAQLTTLDDVVAFFDRGGDATGYPGKNELQPIGLSKRERTDLVAFLEALDGPGPSSDLLSPP